MIESLAAKLATAILTPFLLIAGFFTTEAPQASIEHESESLGAQLPEGVAIFQTSLASAIQGSSTEMTLVQNSIRGGGSLSGYNCFTIDIGSSESEYVCGTVSGTSVTGLERGLSPEDGVTQVATLKFAHRRGASVQITDFPLIQRLRDQVDGDSTFDNVISYAPGVTPVGSDDIADVGYVLSTITGTSSLVLDELAVPGNAGETFATGSVLYFQENDQEWYKLDVDIDSHFVDREIGMANGAGSNGVAIPGGVTIRGLFTTSNLTAGANYFASSTAGATSTATTSQPLGVARSTTQLYFNPSLIESTVYTPTTFSATTTFSGWVDGIASTTVRYYTTTGASTWTKPANLKYAVIETVSAGGGGDDDSGGGGSGGAGAYCRAHLSALDLVATSTVVVRVGTGGVYNGGTPTAGSASEFGTFCSSSGGSPASAQTGGVGGTATLGDLLISGGRGGNGDATEAYRGTAGVSFYGGGGAPGSGGNCSVDPGAGSCAGFNGIVTITEHF